jgi:uroporphyrinogen decarboxylase
MKPMERVFRAFSLEEPDRVPLWEGWITNDGVYEAVIGCSLDDYLNEFLTKTPISEEEDRIRRAKLLAEAQIKCYRRLGLDMSPIWGAAPPYGWKPTRIDEQTFITETGAIHRHSPKSHQTWIVDYPVKTPEDAEKYVYPDPHAPGRLDHVKALVEKAHKYDMPAVIEVGGGLEYTIEEVISLPNLIVLMFRYPNLARRLVNMVVDFSIEIGKAAIDMGVDAIEISNDSGYVSGPMLSPKLFHEFITPTLERQVRTFKRKGAIVFVHCDGNVYPILDDMVGAGIDGWHAIEPQAGMDIGYVKEKYGDRICLIGNIDVSHTLPFGSEEDVVREVKERINLAAPGGGYILSSSNSIHRGVKPSNAIAMYRAGRKYGVYVKR